MSCQHGTGLLILGRVSLNIYVSHIPYAIIASPGDKAYMKVQILPSYSNVRFRIFSMAAKCIVSKVQAGGCGDGIMVWAMFALVTLEPILHTQQSLTKVHFVDII